MSADRAAAAKLIDVSRETWERLGHLVDLLGKWQATVNLVAPNTLGYVWTRHIADSAQLAALAPPDLRLWIDLGSGAGFPGLVIAAMRPECRVHLVESNGKKAAFLREAGRAMALDVTVWADRAEAVIPDRVARADVVSARALAPLVDLVALAAPLLKTGAVGLFPKGRTAEVELTAAHDVWHLDATLHPSVTDPEGRIVRIEGIDGSATDTGISAGRRHAG